MIHVSYVKFAQNDIDESIETQALKRKHDLSKHVSSIEGTFRIHPERSHVPGWRRKKNDTKTNKENQTKKRHESLTDQRHLSMVAWMSDFNCFVLTTWAKYRRNRKKGEMEGNRMFRSLEDIPFRALWSFKVSSGLPSWLNPSSNCWHESNSASLNRCRYSTTVSVWPEQRACKKTPWGSGLPWTDVI